MRRLLAVPALALVLAGCTSTQPTPPPSGRQVTYQVTGTASAVSVTYTVGGTDTAQEADRPLPYEKVVDVPKGGGFPYAYLSAQNQGEAGDVTCTILTDGKVVKTSTRSGGFQICQVSAS